MKNHIFSIIMPVSFQKQLLLICIKSLKISGHQLDKTTKMAFKVKIVLEKIKIVKS